MPVTDELPGDRPIFSFYGDDFTGSTDALDALARHGIRTVLFLRTPADADLAAFRGYRAVGIAGDSRSQTPDWMRAQLPAVFESLKKIGAPVVQYKVCSTFDSSADRGSIGCALEMGQDTFGVPMVPVVAAAPILRRYVVFGNLFAGWGDSTVRIDRHPSMSRHPVTPMGEADLRLHLARQTSRRIGLIDIGALRDGGSERLKQVLEEQPAGILFDGLDSASMEKSAALIWEHRQREQCFVIASSGFTHGLLDYWKAQGWIEAAATLPAVQPVKRIVVLSGSRSPATERQIQYAIRAGFAGLPLNAAQLARTGSNGPYQEVVLSKALGKLYKGHSVILYLEPQPEADDRQSLASEMGKLLRALIARSGVRRAVVAGGDTSSHAVRELDAAALTFLAPLAPGAPLCQVHGKDMKPSGVELVLKGGQVGSERFFEEALRGASKP
jgi:uncharacterized protein YgbK (DUF1537 family)